MAEPSADDLQALALMRLEDAEALLIQERHSAAYYLAGYAVECALKAIIAHSFRRAVIPSRRLVDAVYKHNLLELAGTAGLTQAIKDQERRSAEFQSNWAIVTAWSETVRYEIIDPFRARAMIQAVGHSEDGILTWLKTRW